MTEENLKEIQKTINYTFKNPILLQQAFVRKSFAEENPEWQDNEVLEFFGDSVLNTYLSKILYDTFKGFKDNQFVSKKNQGELTKIRSKNSDKECLSHCVEILGFEKYLLLGNSDRKNKAWESNSVKEDLFEAIIGAVAIDCEWDWNMIFPVCSGMLKMGDFEDNAIEELAAWCEEHGYEVPSYSPPLNRVLWEVQKNGMFQRDFMLPRPDYRSCVLIKEINKKFIGEDAESEYVAQMTAADKALNYLIVQEMISEVGQPDEGNAVSQLHELFQKDFIEEPKYTFEETHDENGNPVWQCFCDFAELESPVEAVDSSKKEVKRVASYTALCQLMDTKPYEE